jgi:uncharacterized C2H2 Zn-finger protein
MKKTRMDMKSEELLRCDRCDEWIANQYVWIRIDNDGGFNELICEKCHEKEEIEEGKETR